MNFGSYNIGKSFNERNRRTEGVTDLYKIQWRVLNGVPVFGSFNEGKRRWNLKLWRLNKVSRSELLRFFFICISSIVWFSSHTNLTCGASMDFCYFCYIYIILFFQYVDTGQKWPPGFGHRRPTCNKDQQQPPTDHT